MSKPASQTGTASELQRVSQSRAVHLHVHSESRSALPLKHRTMETTLHVAIWATDCSLHTQAPVGCCVAHPLLVAGHTPGQWVLQLDLYTAPHTQEPSKESVHDVSRCGRIASRDKHIIFLVRWSCRVRNADGRYRFFRSRSSL